MGKSNDILQNTATLVREVEALKKQNGEVLETIRRQGQTAEELARLYREREEVSAKLEALRRESKDLTAEMEKLRREKATLTQELENLRAQASFLRESQARAAAPAASATGKTVAAPARVRTAAHVAEDGYIYFGEYPQTVKAASVTVSDVKDARGYYLGSDGCYYAKAEAEAENAHLSDGTSTVSGFTYYFKVEPVKWRILSKKSDGTALLLADRILDRHRFDASSGNYEKSEIRAWLNGEFLQTAFAAEQQERILVTNVDNSLQSTCDTSNPYTCKNTSDKIFLLSAEEATRTAYGFSNSQGSSQTRVKSGSDYVLAQGGGTYWWLRSPDRSSSGGARGVNRGGEFSYVFFNYVYSAYGVAPALQIRL